MIVVGCSKGDVIGRRIAKKLKVKYSKLEIKRFPDGELYLRFLTNLKNKKVILVQSFYGSIDELIVETIFAARTAKDLGAKEVKLIAPHFPYFRQDTRFKEGECVSLQVIRELFNKYFDKVIVVDPHLHREKKLKGVFRKVSSNSEISDYIKKNYKDPILIGPDIESYQWAKKIGDELGFESSILRKKRRGSRDVEVKVKDKINIKNKEVIIIDDIISTGHTLLQTIKAMKKLKPKKINCICIHGIFAENALKKIKKLNVNVISTNTIISMASKIDVSGIIAEGI